MHNFLFPLDIICEIVQRRKVQIFKDIIKMSLTEFSVLGFAIEKQSKTSFYKEFL